MKATRAIAVNVFRESVRDKVLYNLVLFALLLIGSSYLLGKLTAGQDIKIIKDLGLAATSLFGLFIAVFIGIGLVSKEVERRSVYSLLSKPIRRSQLVLGKYCGLTLTLAVNMVLAAALLAAVPRLRMTVRRMTPPVLQVGIGIMLLNTVGKSFVGLVERNPAYGLVASAVGVLVYLYVFNQLLLFGAAWAATSPHGRVVDLSADDKTAPVGQNTWIRHSRPE